MCVKIFIKRTVVCIDAFLILCVFCYYLFLVITVYKSHASEYICDPTCVNGL